MVVVSGREGVGGWECEPLNWSLGEPLFLSAGKELTKSMTVLTNLRKAANHPLLLRNHYSDDIIASMSTEILKVYTFIIVIHDDEVRQ